MTLLQIIIIVAGLFIGYRLVSYMLSPGTGDDDPRSRPPPDPRHAADEGRERPRPWGWHDTAAPPWYETLGVSETASREQIDSAYRQQISQYHPDKVATMGEEIRRVAEARTKAINAAYDVAVGIRR
ncbi:J domain-containing protein [Rhodanobacter sp. AS-Z3]|uniref:J domain-containing protein n=1 Tax=Rhodanobacter sp. AS-Z3 TaxID=3031330 RepID=UPI0024795BB7|nr:J domain-containing protein [Rhodanobacter sp. AS-Z3]WEN15060.1 J domain-containing protein [Rhodanobacter sp. AS-Z3]